MKGLFLVICALAVIGQAYAGLLKGKCRQIDARPFDPSRYVGLWYEQYRFSIIFEDGLTCVTAEYSPINATTVGVKNGGKSM
jgi:lipocalin